MSSAPEPDPHLIEEFVQEADEGLQEVEQALLEMEQDPDQPGLVDQVFRPVHSMKGVCGFLGLKSLGRLCHIGETLLARVRGGELVLDEPRIQLLFQMLDELRDRVAILREEGPNGLIDDEGPEELLVLLERASSKEGTPEESSEKSDSGISPEEKEARLAAFRSSCLGPCEFLEADIMLLEVNPEDRTLLERVVVVLRDVQGQAESAGVELMALLSKTMQAGLERDSQSRGADFWAHLQDARSHLCVFLGASAELESSWGEQAKRLSECLGGSPSVVSSEEDLDDEESAMLASFFRASEEHVESIRGNLDRISHREYDAIRPVLRRIHSLKGAAKQVRFGEIVEVANKMEDAAVEIQDRPEANRSKFVRILRSQMEGLERFLLNRMHERMPHLVNKKMLGEILLDEGSIRPEDLQSALDQQASQRKLGEILVDQGKVSQGALQKAMAQQKLNTRRRSRARSLKAAGQSTIRVDERKLDRFMSLVAELTTTKNRLLHLSDPISGEESSTELDGRMDRTVSEVARIANEMQNLVLELRMVPVRKVFERIPRMVRDLGRQLGKKVDLKLEGENTEIDRMMVEKISDPLVHLVRNAVDHGLESTEERLAAGKSETGWLCIRAGHDGDSIYIEVSDDGGGIDASRIAERSLAKGIVRADEMAGMSEEEIFDLIFRPGFSTAESVSEVSGRGVGLDVVQRNIEELKGEIRISSDLGQGSTFRIQLPLTLAVDVALLLEAGGQTFALPMDCVLETLKIPADRLIDLDQTGVMVHRGRPLAIVELADLLGVPPSERLSGKDCSVVVLGRGEEQIGLIVDRFLAKQDIVIKPLEGGIEEVPGFEGATVLGDGRVVLILSVADLIRMSGEQPILQNV